MRPRVIKTDANHSYVPAIKSAKKVNYLPEETEHRPVEYLNNRIDKFKKSLSFIYFCTSAKTYASCMSASVRSIIALGERRGNNLRFIGQGFGNIKRELR